MESFLIYILHSALSIGSDGNDIVARRDKINEFSISFNLNTFSRRTTDQQKRTKKKELNIKLNPQSKIPIS